ncbi:MAG: hypothetical protein OXL96_00950 [Candidatus Poribacteria bacterium]|nr:hypothetical protein [Candidatus Poribacteria bacterium]
MKFLKSRTLTLRTQLFIGIPLLIVLVFLVAIFTLQATTNARLSDELTSLKRDYDAVVGKHVILARGYYHSEMNVLGEYTFNIISDRTEDGYLLHACYPINVEETKATLAPVKARHARNIESHLLVFGRIRQDRDIIYNEDGIGYILKDCRIMDIKVK